MWYLDSKLFTEYQKETFKNILVNEVIKKSNKYIVKYPIDNLEDKSLFFNGYEILIDNNTLLKIDEFEIDNLNRYIGYFNEYKRGIISEYMKKHDIFNIEFFINDKKILGINDFKKYIIYEKEVYKYFEKFHSMFEEISTDLTMCNISSGYIKEIRPFLKWAGGKRQLLKYISLYYPFDGNITKYAEPFVGGGAVLFDILSKYSLEEIYISDINPELINTYNIIKCNVNELIELLLKFQDEFLLLQMKERKEYYLLKREKFNNLMLNKNYMDNIEKAALMIFLNKTCFNGLFRVNKKGLFNVPMGKYKYPLICDKDNLLAISDRLKNVNIICGDYTKALDFIDEHTFVYIDPPYRPINKTSNFTAYTKNTFDDEKQNALVKFVDEINMRKAKIVVSNSDPKNEDENDNFFDILYSKYRINRIKANRMINSKAESRGKVSELLISNFEVKNMG